MEDEGQSLRPKADVGFWIKNLPNKLTLGRILAIPLLLLIFPWQQETESFGPFIRITSALIFSAAALTDFFDGYLARKMDAVTPLGTVLDPLADKMLVGSGLILLADSQVIPAFLAGLLICRDLGVSGMRLAASQRGVNIEVSAWGKWKTATTDIAVFCLLINETILGLPFHDVGMVFLYAGIFLSLYSAWDYAAQLKDKLSLFSEATNSSKSDLIPQNLAD
jgi:CDP-diacylglycerol---glycerol-3-phosphate 3-phosphatidyltransferase